jgi:hypothetical protein
MATKPAAAAPKLEPEKHAAEPAAAAPAPAKPAGGPAPGPAPMELLKGVVRGLSENRLKLVLASAADLGNVFAAVTPAGTPFDKVLEPAFWAHTAYKLRPGDEIVVHTDDMSYHGRLYVRDVSAPGTQRLNNRAVVAQLSFTEFDTLSKHQRSTTHDVRHLGPHLKWCVIALADNRTVKDNCGTQDEAWAWVRANAAAA